MLNIIFIVLNENENWNYVLKFLFCFFFTQFRLRVITWIALHWPYTIQTRVLVLFNCVFSDSRLGHVRLFTQVLFFRKIKILIVFMNYLGVNIVKWIPRTGSVRFIDKNKNLITTELSSLISQTINENSIETCRSNILMVITDEKKNDFKCLNENQKNYRESV